MEDLKKKELNDVAIEMPSRENLNQKKLSSLPDELLMKIMGLLPHSDLSAMMIVDKKFNHLTSDPALWRRYPIPAMTFAKLQGLDILLKVLESPKFSKLEVLDLNSVLRNDMIGRRLPRKELQLKFMDILRMASTLPLKRLDLSHNSFNLGYNTKWRLSYQDQDFLVRMVLNIQHVGLDATDTMFTKEHNQISVLLLDKILDRVSETSVLRSISLRYCDLDHLSVSSVVKLNCLSEVSLDGASMKEEQARALMVEMGKGTNIKKFDIYITDAVDYHDVLEKVEPEIVAKALNNVEHLIYNKTGFWFKDYRDMEPDVHLARFLEEMGEEATSLKKFDIKGNNYYHVSPNVVAKAFNKLEYLELKPNPTITSQQITAVFQLMAKQTNVVNLKFTDKIILCSYHPGLLARAVVQVEQVDVLCMLPMGHIIAVLRQLDINSRLKRLNLGNNDVSEVPGHVLEKAVKVLGKNGGTVIVTQTLGMKYVRY